MFNKAVVYFKENFYLFLVFAIALLLRFWDLGNFPIAITHDELEYIMQAKSLYYTGAGIPSAPPFGLFSWGQQVSGNVLAELPSFLISPLVGPFSSSLFVSRVVYAIVSAFMVIIIYFLFKLLTQKKNLSILASLVLALNPWSIHFGRTSFEFTLSVFFYLIGIYLVIKANKWNILYSMPFFLVGFFSYHGAKLLYFPLILLLCLWKYFNPKEINKKPLIFLISLSLSVCLFYIATINNQPSNARTGELIFLGPTINSEAVINERKLSIPGLQQEIFLNKATNFSEDLIVTYLHNFSTDFLFITGENRGAYSFGIHGLFYYFDFLFIIFGLIGLYIVNKKGWLLIVSILAIAPIASVLSTGERSYVIRSALIFPFLASLSGIGIWFIVTSLKKYRVIVGGIIFLVYLFSVLNFLNLYFTRYPVYNSEGFFFSNKVLSRYAGMFLSKSEGDLIVSTTEPRILFEKFLFYNNLYNQENAGSINQQIAEMNFSYKNIKFINRCDFADEIGGATYLYEAKMDCEKQIEPTSRILSPRDAGTQFVIKNDKICRSFDLLPYPRVESAKDFDLYKLSDDDFCKTWISRL